MQAGCGGNEASASADSSDNVRGIVAATQAAARPRVPLTEDEVVSCEAYRIISQFKTPKDIRVSVRGEYWECLPQLHGRRLEGTILQWAKRDPPNIKLKVQWEDGHDTEFLDQLFHPDFDLKFLPYIDGRPAPKLVGRAAARACQVLTQSDPKESVVVNYNDGSVSKQQVWYVEQPESVIQDQRTQEWNRPKLNRPKKSLETPYEMWVNAALPLGWVSKLVTFFNQRLSGEKSDAQNRKTSPGEIIRFFGYMSALCVERGLPVDDMWRNQLLDNT